MLPSSSSTKQSRSSAEDDASLEQSIPPWPSSPPSPSPTKTLQPPPAEPEAMDKQHQLLQQREVQQHQQQQEQREPDLHQQQTKPSRRVTMLTTLTNDAFKHGIWDFTYTYFFQYGAFWFVTTLLILMEPVLCSYDPYSHPIVLKLQIAVLALSTACFIIQLIGSVAYKNRPNYISSHKKAVGTSNVEQLRVLLFTGAFVLEFFCLLCGWVFIFYRPGVAAIRCFRVFRILYYHELPEGLGDEKGQGVLDSVKFGLTKLFYLFGGERHTLLVLRVSEFASKCLQNMAQEMFFLTDTTRGGFILMVMLFYSAFVIGCAVWIDVRGQILDVDHCNTLGKCVYTMLRLTFYDGNGFDMLWALNAHNKFLFSIVVVYLCSTAFGILNGLIGIFGDIYNDESDRVFVKDTATAEDVEKLDLDIVSLISEVKAMTSALDAVTSRLAELQ